MAELKQLVGRLSNISKQMKFAQARALTRVSRLIQSEEQSNIEKTFDNPTPFTLKSVKSIGARRDNLQAKVFIQSIAASYLEPYETGGVHKLAGKALLNPKSIRLNKYGNIPRTRPKTLAAREDVFIGTVNTDAGDVSGIWQRKKRTTIKKRSRSKGGTSKQRGQLKLLIRFGEAMPVKQRLRFYDVADQTFSRSYQGILKEEVRNAFETAKR